ncbi:MAG: threonine synthase [Anaerolineales bacterium]|nr:threonine synthase [Anaerolineales bacterium]
MTQIQTTNYLKNLKCSSCNHSYDPDRLQTFCANCNAPLLAEYDLAQARVQLDRDRIACRRRGMWRWGELLPVRDARNVVDLGEGDTPLLSAPRLSRNLELNQVYIKDESLNPTGSFKARGLSAAVSKAKELGARRLIIPTAGNAGGALAAYAARAGLEACIYMPKDTPRANIEESRIVGAQVVLVDGLISDAGRLAGVRAQTEGWFDVSTFKEPYRCEGKKIMGYELAEAFNWRLPEVIVYPTGGGTGLVGMWKAFKEMAALGWLESNILPRMVAVQASGCAPVIKAFHEGAETCQFWEGAQTIASGLRVPKSFADRLILRNLRESKGIAIAVSDEEILRAQKKMAELEGVFAAPEGAATLAALTRLVESGWVQPDERVVLFNTGAGLKYLS